MCLTLSLVLARLADGYDLVRQSIPRSVYQLALYKEKKEAVVKLKGKSKCPYLVRGTSS